jgi:hypothetical protein
MSFKAELTIEGKTFGLRSFFLRIDREEDSKGRPSSLPSWGMEMTIDTVDDTTITNWMIDPGKQIDGKIVFYKIDEDSKLKEIGFKKCYCYFLQDSFMTDFSFTKSEFFVAGGELDIGSSKIIT